MAHKTDTLPAGRSHEVVGITKFACFGKGLLVERAGCNPRRRQAFDHLLDLQHSGMGIDEFRRKRSQRKNPGMSRQVTIVGKHVVDQYRFVAFDSLKSRSLGDGRAGAGAAGG